MTENVDKNVMKTVVESADATTEKLSEDNTKRIESTITMSNGVVFELREVPQVAYVDLRNSLPEPYPPIFYNEDTGKEEPNFNDPRYKAEYASWEVAISTGIIDISILFGAKIKSIPDGVIHPNSQEFMDVLSVMLKRFGWSQKEIREIGKTEKYLTWVKYYATEGLFGDSKKEGDMDRLLNAIGRMSGVPEADVSKAVDNFRN